MLMPVRLELSGGGAIIDPPFDVKFILEAREFIGFPPGSSPPPSFLSGSMRLRAF